MDAEVYPIASLDYEVAIARRVQQLRFLDGNWETILVH